MTKSPKTESELLPSVEMAVIRPARSRYNIPWEVVGRRLVPNVNVVWPLDEGVVCKLIHFSSLRESEPSKVSLWIQVVPFESRFFCLMGRVQELRNPKM